MIQPRRIYDMSLTHKAVAVYAYLCNRADRQGRCYPSVKRISYDLNISKSTVFRAFRELEDNGLLERKSRFLMKGGQATSMYQIKGEITPAAGGDGEECSNG